MLLRGAMARQTVRAWRQRENAECAARRREEPGTHARSASITQRKILRVARRRAAKNSDVRARWRVMADNCPRFAPGVAEADMADALRLSMSPPMPRPVTATLRHLPSRPPRPSPKRPPYPPPRHCCSRLYHYFSVRCPVSMPSADAATHARLTRGRRRSAAGARWCAYGVINNIICYRMSIPCAA